MSEWKDVSSRTRAYKPEELGCSFERDVGGVRMLVTRHIHLAPTDWKIVLGIGPDVTLSGNRTADEAKSWAERHAIVRLKNMLVALGDTSVLIGGAK